MGSNKQNDLKKKKLQDRARSRKLLMLSFDRDINTPDEERGEIRDNVLTFIHAHKGKVFKCPVESTLLFISEFNMDAWIKYANEDESGLLKHVHVIIGQIDQPGKSESFFSNEDDLFYAKSNSQLGKQLFRDLVRLKFISDTQYEVTTLGTIKKK